MSRALPQFVLLACATLGVNAAFADTALQNGVPATLTTLPASNYLSNYYIDVDATAKQLAINLAGSGGDLDLFLRYGTPFPVQNPSASYATVSEDLLNRYAHYHSTSSTSNESILVLPSSRIPLQAGRWYIDVINGGTSTANGTLTATASATASLASFTIDFNNPFTDPKDPTNDCDVTYWTDPTPATPVGGNPGITVGQQRQNALNYAALQLVQQLQIPVPISVQACGAHLGGDAHSATLAHASPLSYFEDEPAGPLNMLPKKYTWYASTIATRLGGTSLCGLVGGPCAGTNSEALEATFNMDLGKSTVLGGENFYYGYTPNAGGGNSIDFVHIAMHEMTHGLGFLGLVNTDPTQGPLGAKAGVSGNSIAYTNLSDGPFNDIFDDNVAIVDNGAGTYTPFTGYEVNGSNDAARAAALVSGPTITSPGQYTPGLYSGFYGPYTGLRWSDATADNAQGINNFYGMPAPQNFPSLYAPCDKSATPAPATCAMQNGSTLSHTVQPGDMMNAYDSGQNLRSMGLAVPMLAAEGWSDATATMPTFTQPIPSAWYDRSHSGHGFDFQLGFHDPIHGDVYILTFYTYTANGTPEWYEASGHLVDGVFTPDLDQNGNTLARVIYTTTASAIVSHVADPSINGSIIVDFNQATNSPVCRNVDRSAATQLGVMSWSIGGDSGTWCVEPIVALSAHATPDYNGLWYAPSDSGWGFELLDVAISGSAPAINVLMYLPAADGRSTTWLTGSGTLAGSTTNLDLYQITNGYCRTCTPPASVTGPKIGTMTLSFDTIKGTSVPTGKATIQASYVGGGGFNRNVIPIQMLSVPTGQ